jgi:hypothetical protein
MDELTEHERNVLREALSVEEGEPPLPWRREALIFAGGVIAAGWTREENILLVSHSGFGIFTPSGAQLQRDHDVKRAYSALSWESLTFTIPQQRGVVPVFGINGGEGCHLTSDGWSVDLIYPQWPRTRVLLRAPSGQGVGNRGSFAGATRLQIEGLDIHDWLRAAFSPSGKRLMVVGSSGCLVFTRGDRAPA